MEIKTRHGIFFILCAIFVQMGGASVFSVGFLGFSICLYIFIVSYKKYFFDIILISAVIFFANVLFFVYNESFSGIILRALRVYICFLVVCFAGHSSVKFKIGGNAIVFGILLFQIYIFLFILLQFWAIKFGDPQGLFLPWEFYGNTAGDEIDGKRLTTLPSYWLEFGFDKGLLLGDEFKIRPSASYSEPSYVGFLCLACFFVLSYSGLNLIIGISFILSAASSILCESASGIIIISAFAIFRFKEKILSDMRLISLAIPLLFLILSFSDVHRVLDVGNMHDEASGFIRIVKPVINIINQFGDGYFLGMPEYMMTKYHSDYYNGVLIGRGLDNGVFNIIMTTGVFSPFLFAILKRVAGVDFFVFFILGAVINGSPFSFDKTFIFFTAAILAKSIKDQHKIIFMWR